MTVQMILLHVQPNMLGQHIDLKVGDKANAWNYFVHEKLDLLFHGGDCQIKSSALNTWKNASIHILMPSQAF